ncbi:MAG: alkaline phosphatase family protein [Rhodothermia bacterium]|nr:alkaline phosphatase family protein [Rhodothermia bacterium]
MNFLMVFVDGVGVGQDDPDINPFARFDLPTIDLLLKAPRDGDGRILRHIDANLGVKGLPQSGTGQATLLTGKNCAEIAGRHFGPFPHTATRDAIADHNIFRQVERRCESQAICSAFANAYPPPFFERVKRRNRWTVTTRCCLDAGVRIRNLEDLAASDALAADITGERLERAGFSVTPVSEEAAAAALLRLATKHRYTLFEYFLTDKAGHNQSFDEARLVLESLDRFLAKLISTLEPDEVTLILTSDHGNLEDLSTKSHTRNPVPLVVVGEAAPSFAAVESIVDIVPTIMDALKG